MKLSATLLLLATGTDSFGELKSKKRQGLTRYGWKWPKCKNIDSCGKNFEKKINFFLKYLKKNIFFFQF